MPSRSAEAGKAAGLRYDPVARAMHWLAAILVFFLVPLGWAMETAPRNAGTRDYLFLLHRSLGLTVLAIMLFRALWRWRHPPPPLPAGLPRLVLIASHGNHLLLYLVFIAMPLAGYVTAAAAGHAVSFFGLFAIPPLIPEDERLSQAAVALHLAGQYLVYLFVAAHVAAVLYHGVVRRDGIVERML